MALSKLQRYILLNVWQSTRTKVARQIFYKFYGTKKSPPLSLQTKIITKSIERLIDRGLLIGYGTKTQYKLFIEQVQLTSQGKKIARLSFGKQASFPWSKK